MHNASATNEKRKKSFVGDDEGEKAKDRNPCKDGRRGKHFLARARAPVLRFFANEKAPPQRQRESTRDEQMPQERSQHIGQYVTMEEENNNNNNDHQHHPSSSTEQQLVAAVRARDRLAVVEALSGAPATFNINVVVVVQEDDENDGEQPTPLHTAAWNGDLEIVHILLDSRHHYGVNTEARDRKGKTPLQLACAEGHLPVARALLDHGADLETTDAERTTPLMWACFRQHRDVALFLIKRGACIGFQDYYGSTALHYICDRGDHDHSTVVEKLLEKGADVNAACDEKLGTPLHCAANMGKVESMRLLLANGSDWNAKDIESITPLHEAVGNNHLEAVRLLLDCGADIEAKEVLGLTPLHVVNSLEVTEELLRRGANIFERAFYDLTPFESANNISISQRILRHYRDLIVETHGRLSIHAILKEAKYVKVIEELEEDGDGGDEEENEENEDVILRVTMVSLPLGKIHIEMMLDSLLQVLLSQDPDMIRAQDTHRLTPLHIACQDAENTPIEVLRWLVEQNLSTLHYGDSFGRLPLHLACRQARAPLETVQFLVEQGGVGTLCARDHEGALPLHLMMSRVSDTTDPAADNTADDELSPKIDGVEYLVKEYPRSVVTPNNNGEWPIMLACQSSAPEDVLFILMRAYPPSIAYMYEHYNT